MATHPYLTAQQTRVYAKAWRRIGWELEMAAEERFPRRDIGLISFFTGVGGLDLGFEASGFRTWMANEIYEPYVRGYLHARALVGGEAPVRGIYLSSVEAYLSDNWRALALAASMGEAREETGLVGFIGGPPCPDFSIAGKQAGEFGINGRLTQSYIDLVCHMQPDFFVFENVRGLWSTRTHRAFYAALVRQLEAAGYCISDRMVNSLRYWVPQDRRRVMAIGFRRKSFSRGYGAGPLAETFPWDEHAWDEALDPFALDWPQTDDFVEDGRLPCPAEVPMELTPEWWFGRNAVTSHANRIHCFRPQKETSRFGSVREGDTSGKSFKRLHRWRYSPTVAYGNNEVHLHPYKRRRLTVAEAMALQTMPKDFALPPDMSLSDMFKTIGNAVPFMLGEAIANTLAKVLLGASNGPPPKRPPGFRAG
jgi:DNA (cytosine-5)-methyltransferase 1